MELVLTDGKVLEELSKTDKSLWEKIRDWIADVIDKIRKHYGELNQASKTAQVLKETVESLDEIERMFTEGVREAGERTRTAGTGTGMDEGNRQIKYSSEESIDADLLDFYYSVMSMQDKNAIGKRKKNLGKISENHAQIVYDAIKKETGKTLDVSGYELWIDGSAIRHIDEKHGRNGTSDHSMQNPKDVARIEWAANYAESGKIARTQNGEIDYSTQYRNSDGSPSPKVILEKTIGDRNFIIAECVPDTNSKKIHIISARIQKGDKGQVLNVESSDSPQPTSETPLDGNVTNNSITQPEDSVNRKFSIYEENSSDTAYLAAVERGDMVTAQRMVDEAAKAAGYAVKAAHYTDASFTEFDPDKIGSSQDDGYFGKGFYFTSRSGFGNSFGENRMNVYLSAKNPLVISELSYSDKRDLYEYITEHPSDEALESGFEMREEDGETVVYNPTYDKSFGYYDLDSSALHHGYFGTVFSQAITDWAQRNGYDAIFSENPNGDGSEVREIVLFSNRKVKSADPVTYDDNGNVIPLSERFKEDNSDIRYSIDETPETPDVSENATDKNVGDTEDEISDRDLLLAMAERLVGSEEENRILTNYKTNYDTQKARQARLDELTAEMQEQQSIMMYDQSADKRSAAAKRLPDIYKEMSKISEQLADADRKLTEIEGRTDDESLQ